MALKVGARLGPYEIVSAIGAGGMGEVYRARDTRLGRTVAIKVLPADVASDAAHRQRFEQEARAISALNHPHICTLHDIGHDDGVDFLVMEYLEGETLAAVLDRAPARPVPLDEPLQIAIQIASALDKAHQHGIVHRDLKPGNIMLTKGGVKLLDFGLAKLRGDAPPLDGLTRSVPRDLPLTAQGAIVGTLQYMAPEQLEAREVDPRADIFAFGAVLYEMLTGRKAFDGTSQASVISAIMSSDPPAVATLQPLTPASLDGLIRTCLVKDRDDRWASMHDVLLQLKWIAQDKSVVPSTMNRARRRRHFLPWTVAAIAVVAAGVAWASSLRRTAPNVTTHVLSVLPPPGAVLATEEAPAISPDGRRLAYVARNATGQRLLYTCALDGAADAQPIANSDGASQPFWSPTSRSVGFFAQGKLKTADLTTGQIQTLADAGGARGGTWNQEGVIVFVPRPADGPHRISASGGEATPVKISDDPRLRGWFPSFLPDGRHFLLFTPTPNQPENAGVLVVSLDSSTPKRLLASRSTAMYAPPGYLIFWRETTLLAQAFDAASLELRGSPVAIAAAVGFNPITNQSLFSVSHSGTLVFFGGAVGQTQLTWLDRTGKRIGVAGAKGVFNSLSLSPDGNSVVYDEADPRSGTIDLWRLDFARGVPSRMTFHPSHDLFPLWSLDGKRIVFSSLREGAPQLYELSADSAGNETVLFKSPFPKSATGWSGDGSLLIYQVSDPKTSGDVMSLQLTGKAESRSVVATVADERYGTVSRDGRWLAYISNETGSYEVYVRAFPNPGVTRQVSTSSGFEPVWRADGKELFYIASNQTLMAVDFRSSPATFEAGPPKALFTTRMKWLESQAGAQHYGASADGQRFLVANATDEAQSAAMTIVLNWATALERR
jgi:serine/threonine protein kinase/Tol biopolymer transport system component